MQFLTLLLCAGAVFAQSFDVASVKVSEKPVGPDYNNRVTLNAAGFSGRNVTLKRLIMEAYSLQPYQVTAAFKWLDGAEYDVEAKSGGPVANEQLRRMLQTLLTDRFHLKTHRETRELRLYDLLVDKGGAKIHPGDAPVEQRRGFEHFHGELSQFANLLAIKLSIPIADDPTKPMMASPTPVPVVDKTGLSGVYDFNFEMKFDLGVDPLALWQPVLQQQLGLRLESRKSMVDVVVVDSADRNPTAN